MGSGRGIGDVANSKRHQQRDKIEIFLPAHPGNQQSCLQENSCQALYVPTCIHLFPHARADTIRVVEHEHNFSKFYQLNHFFPGPTVLHIRK